MSFFSWGSSGAAEAQTQPQPPGAAETPAAASSSSSSSSSAASASSGGRAADASSAGKAPTPPTAFLAPPTRDPEAEFCRQFLMETYTKFAPEQVLKVDELVAAHKGRLEELVADVRRQYANELRRDEIKQQLLEHYAKHQAAKAAIVDDMLARFQGREEELLAEVHRRYPEHSLAAMPLLEAAQVEPELNTSLPIHLQDRRIFHSGFLTQLTNGWLSATQLRWVVLLAQELYVAADPLSPPSSATRIPLKGCRVDDIAPDPSPGQFALRLETATHGVLEFATSNELEKLVWAVKLGVAMLQANPARQANKEARLMYHRVFTEYPLIPVVPYFPDRLETPPEKLDATILSGYVVVNTGDSWVGANWCRRYVTLHHAYFTVRPDKRAAGGQVLYPLRCATMTSDPAAGTFAVTAEFRTAVQYVADTPEEFQRWHAAFRSALEACNVETTRSHAEPAPDAPPAVAGGTAEAETPAEAAEAAPAAALTRPAAAQAPSAAVQPPAVFGTPSEKDFGEKPAPPGPPAELA